MTYIIPKEIDYKNIFHKKSKSGSIKFFYNYDNFIIMGVPFLLSDQDFEINKDILYIKKKDKIQKIVDYIHMNFDLNIEEFKINKSRINKDNICITFTSIYVKNDKKKVGLIVTDESK